MSRYIPLPSVGRARPNSLRLADLYLRQGEQQADAELRAGAIKAQLFSDIGRTVGQTASNIIQAPAQAREQAAVESERAQRAKFSAMQLGEAERGINDRKNYDLAMREGGGSRSRTMKMLEGRPELAEKAQSYFSKVDNTMKQLMEDAAGGIEAFGYTPEAVAAALDDLEDNGFDPKKLAPMRASMTTPEQTKAVIDRLLGRTPTARKTAVVGGNLVDESNGQVLFTAPEKAEKPPAVGSFEDYVTTTYGPRPTPDQIVQARKAYQQADDRPITVNTGQPRPLTQTAEAQIIQRLANQWTTANKPIKELERQVQLMDAGMEAVKRGDRAQGDQVLLVTFQKILDPPSVVRESEYARSAAGQAMMNRVAGAFEQLKAGGSGMKAEELQKFANLAREAAAAQRKAAGLDGTRSRLAKTAERYAIPQELVFDAVADDTPAPPPMAPPAESGGNPFRKPKG